MPEESLDEAKNRLHSETTAQGVFRYLGELEKISARVLTRWVWELLQNARDASVGTDTKLRASIEEDEGEIVFRHNGADFKTDEIYHLIFHGSTKIEDPTTIGQYGSGFLTTHLLSPEIHVSGRFDGGQSFKFPLKREARSVSDLSESMERAWSAFKSSLSKAPVSGAFTTEFRYPLRDDALEAVEKGIASLKRCAPFVVAFNREFSSINIKLPTGTAAFEVVERKSLEQDGLLQVTVAESENESCTEKQYLLVQGQKASVVVPFDSGDDVHCLSIDEIPRLFVGFPLIRTEDFSFPAVINSLSFTPTDERDGVPIAIGLGNNEANAKNQEVIEEACDLLIKLLHFSASSGWGSNHLLANIPPIRERDWLGQDWFRECLAKPLVGSIRQNPVVINGAGEAIPPDDLELPIADTDEEVKALWDLLDGWKGSRERLPRRDEAAGWCAAAKSWASISGEGVSSFKEVTDGRKLAKERIEVECSNFEDLQSYVREDISAVEWLNQLYSFLKNNSLDDLLRTCSLVLDQDGWLDTLVNLHSDKGIAKELKDIAVSLGWNIRQELRDTRLTPLDDYLGLEGWDNDDVLDDLIKMLQERAEKNPDENFSNACVRLFAWIVKEKNYDRLRGFPVFMDEKATIAYLPRNSQDSEPPLAPVQAWPENLRQFSDLFPPANILAEDFYQKVPCSDEWRALAEQSLIRASVVMTTDMNVDKFYPDYPLREGEHKTVAGVTVTDIVNRTGVIDRVQDSQNRGRLFWRFLTEWLVREYPGSLEAKEADCECEETHRYFPSAWLQPLRERTWIRLEDGRYHATAQSLANLLSSQGWEPGSLNENPAAVKLLEAIGITPLDLARAFVPLEDRQKQDNILTEILNAAAGDIDHLSYAREYIEDLKNDQTLPEDLKKRREQRQRVHENQSLGKQVEDLVKENLKIEGFTVRRKPIGSDYEIEYDVVENGEEVGVEVVGKGLRWLIEVKATRGMEVRMTEKQAQTAEKEEDRFLLCVVPVNTGNQSLELDDVRASMRFVQNISPLVAPLCDNLKGFRDDIKEDNHSGVNLVVDLGTARVSVASSVWQNDGFPLGELSNRLLGI